MRTACALFLVGALLVACTGSNAPAPSATPDVKAEAVNPATGKVDVPRDGKHFNPPIAKAELPDGTYYCDMGTVHYARMHKGDGTCPVCGMDLSHDAAAAGPDADPSAEPGAASQPAAEEHEGH